MAETWYVLEDGAAADPRDVAPDTRGKLFHRDGRAVAMRNSDMPMTRWIADPDAARLAVGEAAALSSLLAEARQMKPAAPKRGYKTREQKAE